MAYINDGNADLVAQALQIGQDLLLALLVKRCERLVHQQQSRRGKKSAPDGDALLFSARQAHGTALKKVLYP